MFFQTKTKPLYWILEFRDFYFYGPRQRIALSVLGLEMLALACWKNKEFFYFRNHYFYIFILNFMVFQFANCFSQFWLLVSIRMTICTCPLEICKGCPIETASLNDDYQEPTNFHQSDHLVLHLGKSSYMKTSPSQMKLFGLTEPVPFSLLFSLLPSIFFLPFFDRFSCFLLACRWL